MARFRRTTFTEKSVLPGSPQGSFSQADCRVRRQLFLNGGVDQYQRAMEDFLGYPEFITGQKSNVKFGPLVNYVSRKIPDVILWGQQFPSMYCMSEIGSQGRTFPAYNAGVDATTWQDTELVFEYRQNLWQVREDTDCISTDDKSFWFGYPDEGLLRRNVVRLWKQAGQVRTLPKGFLFYNRDPGEVWPGGLQAFPIAGIGFPVREPTVQLTYIQMDVPINAVPYERFVNQWNTINSIPFDPFRTQGAFHAGCVLFQHVEPKEHDGVRGDRLCDLYFTFLVKWNVDIGGVPRGWNSDLCPIPGSNTYDYRAVSSGQFVAGAFVPGRKPFVESDLHDLFRPIL